MVKKFLTTTDAARITDRDKEILDFISRFRGVTARQLARRFMPGRVYGRTQVYERLRVLMSKGYVVFDSYGTFRDRIFYATRDGLFSLGSPHTFQKPVPSRIVHDTAVVECALHYWEHDPLVGFITEKEIRTQEHNIDPRHARLAVPAIPSVGSTLLYPDLLCRGSSDRVRACELELAPKPHRRLVGNMRSYVGHPTITCVTYWAHPSIIHRVKRAAVAASRTESLLDIEVREWLWHL